MVVMVMLRYPAALLDSKCAICDGDGGDGDGALSCCPIGLQMQCAMVMVVMVMVHYTAALLDSKCAICYVDGGDGDGALSCCPIGLQMCNVRW